MTSQQLTEKGLCVFPLAPGTKIPVYGRSWYENTVNTLEGVQTLEQTYPSCGWGVNAGYSGLTIIDIDMKNGKNGFTPWQELQKQYGAVPKTLIVQTPSGGYHLYFKGRSRNTASKIGLGIDTRGEGGYVVAPGTIIPQGQYKVIQEHPIAEAPDWLLQIIGPPMEKTEVAQLVDEVDKTASVQAAISLLTRSEGAVEGSGTGNDDTFRLACRVKDFGISEDMCLDLMTEHWADKCSPPFQRDGLETLIENAYNYGKNAIGEATAEAAFKDYETPEQYKYSAQYLGSIAEMIRRPTPMFDPEFLDAAWIREDELPRRDWILGHRYIGGYAVQIVAPGGVGKSTLCILDALQVCCNKAVSGETIHKTGTVWIHNAEDPRDELAMRVRAAVNYHQFDLKERQLILTSGRKTKLLVAHIIDGVAAKHESNVKRLIREIKEKQIVLLICDPLIRLHAVKENSNEDMDVVMEAFAEVAEETGCCICLIHHTRKLNKADGAGDMDSARGASSVVSASRVQYTLTTMSEKDAKTYGIDEERRRWYVELRDSKMNMAPPHDARVWYERVSVTISNGEQVGTLRRAELAKVQINDPKAAENGFTAAVAFRDFEPQKVYTLTDLTRAVASQPEWVEISNVTESGLRNRLSRQKESIISQDGALAVHWVHEREKVPGNSAHGFWIEKLKS